MTDIFLIAGESYQHVKILHMCWQLRLHCAYWWLFWQVEDIQECSQVFIKTILQHMIHKNGFDKPVNMVWDFCQLCYATEDSSSINQQVEFCLHLQPRVCYVKKKYYIYVVWGNITNFWGVVCDGLACCPGGVKILLSLLSSYGPVGSKASLFCSYLVVKYLC